MSPQDAVPQQDPGPPTAPSGAQIKGIVNATDGVFARTGPKVTDPKWTGGQNGLLKFQQEVIITGFAIDPAGEENKQRYQIVVSNVTLWTTARYVTVDPALISKIPFVTGSISTTSGGTGGSGTTTTVDPGSAALQALGITLKPRATISPDDATSLAAFPPDFHMTRTW